MNAQYYFKEETALKETWDKIKLTYQDNREAFWLMLAALILFIIICGPEIAEETFSAGDTDAETEYYGETELYAETELYEETELIEAESETETAVMIPDKKDLLAELQNRYGADFIIPMTVPEETDTFLPGEEFLIPELRGIGRQSEESRQGYTFAELEEAAAQQLAGYDGDWSVYVKNLSTDESFVINDRPMKSASVMKLFIMGTVYKAFESGDLERTDEVMYLVTKMITESDNEASNDLLYRLGSGSYERGIEKVDEFISEYGFSEMTVEYNGFNSAAATVDSENFNQVSAKDCGKLLEDIYRRTWVSRSVSNEMEALLLAQNTRYKIPAGLPDGVLCGNKTGEMDTTENDAAIIYAENCDYILVVLSSDWGSKDQAINRIQSISALVYQYLNA